MRPTELIISAFGPYAGEVTLDMASWGTGDFISLRATPEQAKPPCLTPLHLPFTATPAGTAANPGCCAANMPGRMPGPMWRWDFSYSGKEYRVRRNPEYMRTKQRGEGRHGKAGRTASYAGRQARYRGQSGNGGGGRASGP